MRRKTKQTLDERFPNIKVNKNEDLNIERNIKPLVLTALNNSSTEGIAAEKLGISPRTLLRYKYAFNLKTEKINIKSFNTKIKQYS